jgi:hypothetical protein
MAENVDPAVRESVEGFLSRFGDELELPVVVLRDLLEEFIAVAVFVVFRRYVDRALVSEGSHPDLLLCSCGRVGKKSLEDKNSKHYQEKAFGCFFGPS